MHSNQSFSPLPARAPTRCSKMRYIGGVILPLLFVAGTLSTVPNSPSNSSPATKIYRVPQIEVDQSSETKYLVFGIPVNAGQVYQPGGDIYGEIDRHVAALINRVSITGDAKHQLGYMIVIPVWLSDARFGGDRTQIERVISQAFAVAKNRNVAVYFTLYSTSHWMPKLWNWFDPSQPGYDPYNRYNVEWTDWSGTPTKARYSIQEGETRGPPVMCYNSPKILDGVSYIASHILGPALVNSINDLKSAGKENLFGGITLSEELSLDDYTVIDQLNPKLATMMARDGALKTRLGYCALTNLGYSQTNPPEDYPAALAQVNQQYAAYWGKQLVQAGIPKDKLYTHVAVVTEGAHLQYTNAPIDTAFNDYSNPGWTTYLTGPLANGLQLLYQALAKHGNSRWGATETSPTSLTRPSVDPEKFLAWHFNHGATLMVINSADPSAGGQLIGRGIWMPQALAAYKKFLNGGELKE